MNFCRHQGKRYLNLFASQQTKSKVHCPFATTNRWFEEDWKKQAWFQESNLNSSWVLLTLLIRASPPMPYTPHTSLPPLVCSSSVHQSVPLGGSFFLSRRVRVGYNGPWTEGSQKIQRVSSDPVACDSFKTHWTYPEPPVLSGANPEISFWPPFEPT
jgi:hypothetical protein